MVTTLTKLLVYTVYHPWINGGFELGNFDGWTYETDGNISMWVSSATTRYCAKVYTTTMYSAYATFMQPITGNWSTVEFDVGVEVADDISTHSCHVTVWLSFDDNGSLGWCEAYDLTIEGIMSWAHITINKADLWLDSGQTWNAETFIKVQTRAVLPG